jgi:hypothetical protein
MSPAIFTIPSEAIEKTKVDMTIFDGKVITSAERVGGVLASKRTQGLMPTKRHKAAW